MSWLLTNKSGKMVGVELASMEKPKRSDYVFGDKLSDRQIDEYQWLESTKKYEQHLASLRTLEAIGFSLEDDDKMFSDEDVEVVQQLNIAAGKWKDVEEREYLIGQVQFRRIILRKKQPVKQGGITHEEAMKDDFQVPNNITLPNGKQGEQDELWLELFKDLDRWSRSMKGSGDTKIKINDLKSKYIIQKK